MKKFILLLLNMFLFQTSIYAGNINVNQIINEATRNIKLPSNLDSDAKNNLEQQLQDIKKEANKQVKEIKEGKINEENKNIETANKENKVDEAKKDETNITNKPIKEQDTNLANDETTIIETIPIISVEKDEMAVKRQEILDEFQKKLNQNQNTNTKKNINEVIQDDFAIIIKNEDEEKKQKAEAKQEGQLVDIANTPIVEKTEEVVKEEEYKTKYIEELKEAIVKKKEEQAARFKKMISKTAEKADELIGDAFVSKKGDKKASEEEIKLIEQEIELENKKIKQKIQPKDDPEIFNITDTGVSSEIFNREGFDQLLEMRINTGINKPKNNVREIVFPIPIENQLTSFKQYTNSQEVIGVIRFKGSEKAFKNIDSEDFQDIAKKAIDEGDISVLRSVVDFTKNSDYILKNGQTLVNYAANVGNVDMVKYLIFSGANLNIQDYNGNTALHNAILKNDYRIIKLLVVNNISLSTINIDGYTPLMLSVVYGKNNVAIFLLKFKQNLLVKNYRKETVLDLATKYNRVMLKELILDKLENEKK